MTIHAIIDGNHVTRAEVQRWEARRAQRVLKKLTRWLGPPGVAEILPAAADSRTTDLARQRVLLLALKTGIGHAGIYAMLRRELAASEHVARLAVAASRGRTAYSITRLVAPGCSAPEFGQWFTNLTPTDNQADAVDACPDHYLLRGLPDGRQEVVETTGGSPTPTRFLVDYTNVDAVSVPVHDDYPVQIAGAAVLDDGLIIGGVRHQFRDRDGAMEALLTVEFPAMFPSTMIAAHRWHLATEFSNWIIASSQVSR
jgi:hypothetical protein